MGIKKKVIKNTKKQESVCDKDKSLKRKQKEAQVGRSLSSNNDNVASCDVSSNGVKTVVESCKQQEIQIDLIDSNNDYLCVDQIKTPAHASFENDYEYQNVLMDIF